MPFGSPRVSRARPLETRLDASGAFSRSSILASLEVMEIASQAALNGAASVMALSDAFEALVELCPEPNRYQLKGVLAREGTDSHSLLFSCGLVSKRRHMTQTPSQEARIAKHPL